MRMWGEWMDLDKRYRTKVRYPLCELWQPSKTCTSWQSMLHRTLGRGGVGIHLTFMGWVGWSGTAFADLAVDARALESGD